MPAYNFKPRFKEAIQSGEKRQTIRPRRKRPTKAGDSLYLYTGQRTAECELIAFARCISVETMGIYNDGEVWIDHRLLTPSELEEFARADGFESAAAFFEFFRKTYGLDDYNPLAEMELIKWEIE